MAARFSSSGRAFCKTFTRGPFQLQRTLSFTSAHWQTQSVCIHVMASGGTDRLLLAPLRAHAVSGSAPGTLAQASLARCLSYLSVRANTHVCSYNTPRDNTLRQAAVRTDGCKNRIKLQHLQHMHRSFFYSSPPFRPYPLSIGHAYDVNTHRGKRQYRPTAFIEARTSRERWWRPEHLCRLLSAHYSFLSVSETDHKSCVVQ
jgi:hypothetical protein